MSVHKRNGKWQVKWKTPAGARSKTFDRKTDADTYDREIKRRRQLGPTLVAELDRSAITLAEFVTGPWRMYAADLAPKTQGKYRWALTNHLTELVDEPLIAIDVPMLAAHQRRLIDRGLRPATVREVFSQLTGILQIAAEHGLLLNGNNPVRSLRKVKVPPKEPRVPFAPVDLERMISQATGRDRAILILGGYLGLRPIEIRSVPWARLDGDRFHVQQADTKPSAGPRNIYVPAAARAALKEWRLLAGRPADDEPIIGPMQARNMNARNHWIKTLSGRSDAVLYTLRHTHASLLHYAAFTLPEAAERMGHTQIVHVNHYAHVLEALRGKRYPNLDAAISAFRADLENASSDKLTLEKFLG